VSSALHKQGSIVLSFDPKLRPYLLHLKREFTKYGLAVVTQFQSIYSIRIYQLLKQYQNIGWREFKVDELKEILGIKKNQYTVFQDFNKRVLNQAKKEFEQQDEKGRCRCDLTFSVETFRESRKIARLRFTIVTQSTEQTQSAQPVQQKSPAQSAKKHPPLSAEMQEFEQWLKENDAFMYGFLQEHGPNALMVQADYRKFLERREEALQG
jgi:plasmid replication initiation protein